MLCHPETMRVQLKSDDIGFGLSLHGGVSGKRYRPIKIAVIEDGGPAALLVVPSRISRGGRSAPFKVFSLGPLML